MLLHLFVAKHLLTAQTLVVADKLGVLQLPFNFFLHVNEFWLVTHHGALASLFGKLIETDLVVPISAHLALPRVY